MKDDIEFHVHEVLTGEPIGRLIPRSYAFNDPVWGGGGLEMDLAIPGDARRVDSLKRRTMADHVQLFVLMNGAFLWGGIINWRARTPGKRLLKVKAQHWKAWYYTRLFPDRRVYEKDEFSIAYEIMDWAVSEPGTPALYRGGDLADKVKKLTVEPWWSVGQAMDSLGSRDDGFEWSIAFRYGSQTGLPEQFLELWEPGQPRGSNNLLFLDQSESTNKVTVGEIPEDATERRPRVYGTGDGTYPTQTVAKDEDPELKNGAILLRESVTNHSGVTQPETLFDHARAERLRRSAPISTLPVDHPWNSPRVSDYRSGDRARLRIKDEWEDSDRRGVRITDRAISKRVGGLPLATVQLDLLDVREDL